MATATVNIRVQAAGNTAFTLEELDEVTSYLQTCFAGADGALSRLELRLTKTELDSLEFEAETDVFP